MAAGPKPISGTTGDPPAEAGARPAGAMSCTVAGHGQAPAASALALLGLAVLRWRRRRAS
jgi:MYXO-CTERM domain-containing protein